jgi:hypothetical protein
VYVATGSSDASPARRSYNSGVVHGPWALSVRTRELAMKACSEVPSVDHLPSLRRKFTRTLIA